MTWSRLPQGGGATVSRDRAIPFRKRKRLGRQMAATFGNRRAGRLIVLAVLFLCSAIASARYDLTIVLLFVDPGLPGDG